MNYHIASTFCIALLLVTTGSLIAATGSPTDSLLYLLNSDQVKDDLARYDLLCKIAEKEDDATVKLKYSEQAIALAARLNIHPVEAVFFKGEAYLNSGRLASALEFLLQAADYYKADRNNYGLASVYILISEVYNQQENYVNAKYYLQDVIELYTREKDTVNLAAVMLNLGYINYCMGSYDTALIIFSNAREIFQKLDYPLGITYCLGNSGLVYSKQSELVKAEKLLLQAIHEIAGQGDERAVTEWMIAYASVLQQKGEIQKAIAYATTGFSNAKKNRLMEYERDAAYRLAGLYAVTGRFDSAYYYQSLYIVADDSIKNKAGIQKMADLRTEFEVSKKQAEVDVLKKKKTIQLIAITGLTIILILAMGLIAIYYKSLKRSRKLTAALDERRLLLEKQGSELKEHQKELLQQKEELQSTLENLRKTQEQLVESEKMAAIGGLVAGVSHEMNTPLGISITAVSNLLDDVQKMAGLYEKDKISRKEFKGFLESAHDTAGLVQKNLERAASLMQSFKQVSADQVTEHRRVFALKEYLGDILLSLRPKFRDKKIEFNIDCDDNLQLNSYPGVYAQIFTNLLLNSLQHGFHQSDTGTVGVKAEMKGDRLKILYKDDGKGISPKDLPHIFEPFYTSDQHRGTGLGLNIIYNLVKQKLQGTIACESEPGKGVLFTMEVPVE